MKKRKFDLTKLRLEEKVVHEWGKLAIIIGGILLGIISIIVLYLGR